MARSQQAYIWKTEDMAGFVPLALCDDEYAAAALTQVRYTSQCVVDKKLI